MGCFIRYAFVIALCLVFLTITATASLVGAQSQNQTSSNNNTVAHKIEVKIISPPKNTTVPAGQLTIHGISSSLLVLLK